MTTLSNRRYGIEIEAFGATMSAIEAALTTAGINVRAVGYGHSTTPYWKIVSDCSISGLNPFELVSPILQGDEGLRQIEVACKVLSDLGAKVNRSTGLHVHVDGFDFSRSLPKTKNLAKLWMKYETCFDQIVPVSRRNSNNACLQSNLALHGTVEAAFRAIDRAQSLSALMVVTNLAATDSGRYRKLNLCSLYRHGTVEFRHHGGTIDADKIVNWVKFVTDFADEAARMTRVSIKGASEWKWFVGNAKDAAVRKYLKARRDHFVAVATTPEV